MSIKAKLLEKINHIENDRDLEALLNYLEESDKSVLKLSNLDELGIKKSEDQIQSGNFLTQSELSSKVDQWLEK